MTPAARAHITTRHSHLTPLTEHQDIKTRHALTVSVAKPRRLDDDMDGPHANHSSTPDACGERHAIGGHRRPRRGTSMLCDRQSAPAPAAKLPPRRDCNEATDRCGWTLRTPPTWLHSPQCAECNHVGGRVWVGRVRRPASLQNCGIERGRFRRMPDGDYRTRRATSPRSGSRF